MSIGHLYNIVPNEILGVCLGGRGNQVTDWKVEDGGEELKEIEE